MVPDLNGREWRFVGPGRLALEIEFHDYLDLSSSAMADFPVSSDLQLDLCSLIQFLIERLVGHLYIWHINTVFGRLLVQVVGSSSLLPI